MTKITEKQTYERPLIKQVKLDAEISLILMSGNTDPGDPSASLAPYYFNNDPFKNNLG